MKSLKGVIMAFLLLLFCMNLFAESAAQESASLAEDSTTLAEGTTTDSTTLAEGTKMDYTTLAEGTTTDSPTLAEGTTTDSPTLAEGTTTDSPTLAEGTTTDSPTLAEGTTTDSTTLAEGTKMDSPTLAEGTTTDSPTLAEGTTTDSPTLAEGTTTDSPTLAEGTTTDSPTLAEGSIMDSTTLAEGTKTDSPTLAEGTTTDSPTLAEGTTTDSPTLAEVTTTDSPTLAEGTTTDSQTLAEGTTTDSTTLAEGTTTDSPTLAEGTTTDSTTLAEGSTTDSTTLAEGPTTTAEEPTTTAEEPTTLAEEPTTTAEEPTTTAEEPTTTAEEPTTIAEEPTTIAEEPTTESTKLPEEKTSTMKPTTKRTTVITTTQIYPPKPISFARAVFSVPFVLKFKEEFTEDLMDEQSPVYKEKVENYTEQLTEVYNKTEHFEKVEILGFRNGSIDVNYHVIFKYNMMNSSESHENFVTEVNKTKAALLDLPQVDKTFLETKFDEYIAKVTNILSEVSNDPCSLQDVCEQEYKCRNDNGQPACHNKCEDYCNDGEYCEHNDGEPVCWSTTTTTTTAKSTATSPVITKSTAKSTATSPVITKSTAKSTTTPVFTTIYPTASINYARAVFRVPFVLKYHEEFTEDLENKESPVYKEKVENYTEQLTNVYKEVENFERIEINGFSEGSIDVNYTVIFKHIDNHTDIHEDFVKELNNTKDALLKLPNVAEDYVEKHFDIYIEHAIIIVNEVSKDPCKLQDVCEIGYECRSDNGQTAFCFNKCDGYCKNGGDCGHDHHGEPVCSCRPVGSFVYSGRQCEKETEDLGMGKMTIIAIGAGSGCGLLVVLGLVVGTVFKVKRSKKKSGKSKRKQERDSESYRSIKDSEDGLHISPQVVSQVGEFAKQSRKNPYYISVLDEQPSYRQGLPSVTSDLSNGFQGRRSSNMMRPDVMELTRTRSTSQWIEGSPDYPGYVDDRDRRNSLASHHTYSVIRDNDTESVMYHPGRSSYEMTSHFVQGTNVLDFSDTDVYSRYAITRPRVLSEKRQL